MEIAEYIIKNSRIPFQYKFYFREILTRNFVDFMKNASSHNKMEYETKYTSIIFVWFWRWCISIERIVLLDFIHRLVSQEQTKLRN
jgi:hypothetical protein